MDSLLFDSTALQAAQDTLTYVSQDSIVSLLHTLIENTAPDPTPRLGIQMYEWNFWVPIIALIAGLIGTYYGWKGYFFSKKTAENVARLSPDAQYALCRNFTVQLYKNLVRIMVLKYKINHKKDILQNELVALHLPKFEDIFFVDAYYKDAKTFIAMQKMKEEMQTYIELIDIFKTTHSKEDLQNRSKENTKNQTKKKLQEQAKEDLQKIFDQTVKLLAQTKDIVQSIPRTTSGDGTSGWGIKEALAKGFKENCLGDLEIFICWLVVLIPTIIFWDDFVVDMKLTTWYHKLWLVGTMSYVGVGLFICASWIGGSIIYAFSRKKIFSLYNWKRNHPILFRLSTCLIGFIVEVIGYYGVLYFYVKPLFWSMKFVNDPLLVRFRICWISMIIFGILFCIALKKIRKGIRHITATGKFVFAPSIRTLLDTQANSMLDFYLSFLMEYHSQHLLAHKDDISIDTFGKSNYYHELLKENVCNNVLALTQSINCDPACPNPILDNFELASYNLTRQDIEEFKHRAEDNHFGKEYQTILKKQAWTNTDFETLFAHMLSIDAALETK